MIRIEGCERFLIHQAGDCIAQNHVPRKQDLRLSEQQRVVEVLRNTLVCKILKCHLTVRDRVELEALESETPR